MFLNRLPPHWLIGVGIVLVGVRAEMGRVVVTSPSRGRVPEPTKRPSSTLRLQDSSWSQIRVEVRVGSGSDCNALGSLGVHLLQKGQQWAVQFDDPVICWRRDQTPGDPSSTWATWHQLSLADGEVRAVTL